MVDHVDAVGIQPETLDQLPAAVVGMDDDRVHPPVQPSLRGRLAGARLTREQIVAGQHERARGQKRAVEPLHVEPLEVRDVGVAAQAAVAEHVRNVLEQLARLPHPRAGSPAGMPVEVLAHLVARGSRDLPVGETAREEPHGRPGPRERGGERVVVRWRERRRVEDVDAHQRPPPPPSRRPLSSARADAVSSASPPPSA